MPANFRPVAALLVLVAAALPVWADSPASKPVVDQDDDEVVTCESENVTGSRVKKHKVCATSKQRREEREKTSEALDDIRVQGTVQRANGG